jgi:hypothetical protein
MRSCLEARGIFANLDAIHIAVMAWHLTFALQGLTLSVDQSDLDRARDLLGDVTPSAAGGPGVRPDTRKSLSTDVMRAVISVAIWALTGLPCPYWERRWRPDPTNATDPD